jgi:hypothetical protein
MLEDKTKPIFATKSPAKWTTNVPPQSNWQQHKPTKEQKFQQFPQRNWTEQTQLKRKHPHNPSYKLFHIEISKDNVVTQALVDTGASVSAVSEYFFSRLSKNVTKKKIESEDENSIVFAERA